MWWEVDMAKTWGQIKIPSTLRNFFSAGNVRILFCYDYIILTFIYSYKELTCSSTLHSLFLFYHHLCLSWNWTGFYLVAKPGRSLQANFRGSCSSSIQQNNLSGNLTANLLRRRRFLGLACAFRATSSSTRRSYPRPSFTTTIILRETHHHLLFTLINSS